MPASGGFMRGAAARLTIRDTRSTTSVSGRLVVSMASAPGGHISGCGRFARGIQPVALGHLVGLALAFAAADALVGIGVEEKAQIGVGKNHRADVTALHHEPAKAMRARLAGQPALKGEQGRAQLGQGGEVGDGGVDGGAADVGLEHLVAVDLEVGAAPDDPGAQFQVGQLGPHGRRVGRRDAAVEQLGGEGAVVGAGVGVEEIETGRRGRGRWTTCPRRRRCRRWR